ncbi:hypothetical protein WHT_c26110 [Bacillus cereus]|nr:hypothetical protein WHT_c26110 [Bacillus cereus]
MKYHPDYHPNHKKPYSTKGLAYIYKYYGFGKVKEIALALGRTELMIRQLVNTLRKECLKIIKLNVYKDINLLIVMTMKILKLVRWGYLVIVNVKSAGIVLKEGISEI